MVKYLTDNAPDGVVIGQDASEKIGFYGATPIVQTVDTDLVALVTTAATKTTPAGFSTTTQMNKLRNQVIAHNDLFIALGLATDA